MRPIASPAAVIASASALMLLTACGSSSGSSASTSAPASVASSPAAVSSTPPSPSPTASGAAATTVVLKGNVCDMLAASDIKAATGLSVGPGKNLGAGSDAADPQSGSCLWGSTSQGVQLTAYTAANFAKQEARAKALGTPVNGVGQGAWSRGAVKVGSMSNVVLFADYGTVGVILAITTPTASVDTAAALGAKVS
jgi:hypothetical protein